MKKQKWTEKPVTWGGYAVLCVVCYVISLVTLVCYDLAWWEPDWWLKLKDSIRSRFGKKTCKE